jgi:hypothetical protein
LKKALARTRAKSNKDLGEELKLADSRGTRFYEEPCQNASRCPWEALLGANLSRPLCGFYRHFSERHSRFRRFSRAILPASRALPAHRRGGTRAEGPRGHGTDYPPIGWTGPTPTSLNNPCPKSI